MIFSRIVVPRVQLGYVGFHYEVSCGVLKFYVVVLVSRSVDKKFCLRLPKLSTTGVVLPLRFRHGLILLHHYVAILSRESKIFIDCLK